MARGAFPLEQKLRAIFLTTRVIIDRARTKPGGMNMFVENYRWKDAESIMAGGDAAPIPYPKLSAEDWRVWKTFLPIRSQNVDKLAAYNLSSRSLYFSERIPYTVTEEIKRASQYFDRVEVWRKSEVNKDPIAVGVVGGERYLIARWGMEKLIPFATIKKGMPLILGWKYATHPWVSLPA
jgi:hypothetical protein